MDRPEINDWERKVFQSSHVHSGSYSPSTRTLRLTYGNGNEYEYAAPPDIWDQMKSSVSPGRFVTDCIRPNFIGKLVIGKPTGKKK